jgi:hypothetical protein
MPYPVCDYFEPRSRWQRLLALFSKDPDVDFMFAHCTHYAGWVIVKDPKHEVKTCTQHVGALLFQVNLGMTQQIHRLPPFPPPDSTICKSEEEGA